ncbi:helix-turn-helix domain-containing protein [Mycolicibacterium litorale]|uniref:helix-turn-helix domain-containing protein n=1 Tax=Mycolicibacterium litorale TaxID=758802 RepID=UPI0039A1D5A5
MAGKEPDIGPTAKAVADNVRKLREDWDMNYTETSERLLAAANWSINAVGIRRIEAGERRVTPDDLVALALAFGVSPATLLMPSIRTVTATDYVQLTGKPNPVEAVRAWAWLTAQDPFERGSAEVLLSFINRSWPQWERERALSRYRAVTSQMREELYDQLWPDEGPVQTDGDD